MVWGRGCTAPNKSAFEFTQIPLNHAIAAFSMKLAVAGFVPCSTASLTGARVRCGFPLRHQGCEDLGITAKLG